ncbi:MAG: hypothetical protein M0R03_22660 [Novosphingobium sp.]|nr:hypothetical protein [Novosphingobium sp.]
MANKKTTKNDKVNELKTEEKHEELNKNIETKSDEKAKIKIEKIEISKKDLEFLTKEIAELKEQINKQAAQINKPIEVIKDVVEFTLEDEEIVDIPLNRNIKIISLYNGGLTLFTQDHGQGKKFRFEKFGDIRTIQYTDLEACIAVQYKFFEQGYVMILNKDVVKVHGLEETYNKLLTKKQIEEILTYDDQTVEILFKNTTDHIRRVIVDMIVENMLNNKYVDMNKVQIINKYYTRDINEIVAFFREAQRTDKEG